MDYNGLYDDLTMMSKEAAHRAAMWYRHDRAHAVALLEFASECEHFADNLFLYGWGGY